MTTTSTGFTFQLQDLVLCAYRDYLIWSACVQNFHQQKYRDQHIAVLPNENGVPTLHFWVMFPDDESSGWVQEYKIVRYHPLLCYELRRHGGVISKPQGMALSIAHLIFNQLREQHQNFEQLPMFQAPSAQEFAYLKNLANYLDATMDRNLRKRLSKSVISADAQVRFDALSHSHSLTDEQAQADRLAQASQYREAGSSGSVTGEIDDSSRNAGTNSGSAQNR